MGNHTESFGELLRRHRSAAGLTLEALAERAGLSSRGIADLERGVRRAPYRDTVARLVAALGLDAAQRSALVEASRRTINQPAKFNAGREPTPLREQVTSFIGREQALGQVETLLARTRLLTIVGTGGMGKTRLALEFAAKENGRYRDGVCLVELAALTDPVLVPRAASSALGLQDIGTRPAAEAVAEYLRGREVLLVLDNCEHLIHACAELADVLIRSCLGLRILATSREVLAVPGEVAWSVPPLSVPPLRSGVTPEAVESSEAGRLFLDRAFSATPGFRVTAQNASEIARVCQRLDGIPLALELAAARVKVLSVGQIAERLDDTLGLLTSGSRLAPARHQTLRSTLAWSYALLSDPEQQLFDRLCVFAGGWTLEAAEAVCAGDGVESEWILDGLARLVDKSLVLAEPSETGPVRYRLLEPVRGYAEECLAERGESRLLKDRHAEFYIELAERSEQEIHRPSALAVMDMLDREHDNVRVALSWLLSLVDVERSQRLGGAMGRFWLYRSHVAEGEAWLRQALELPGGDAPTVHRLNCLSTLPVFAYTRGDLAALEQTSQEELILGRQVGNQHSEGFALVHVAQAAVLRSDFDQARQHFQAGVDASRAAGSTAAETLNLVGLANVALSQGFDEEARAHAEAALASASEEGWTRGLAQAQRILGMVCHRQGDHARARTLLEGSLDFSRRFGARWWMAGSLISLGILAVDQGELNDAREFLAEGVQVVRELGDWPGVVAGLEGFALLAVALEQPLVGLQLNAAADAIRHRRGMLGRGALGQYLPVVRTSSGEGAAEATALSIEQAVELALRL
jgi:non-specific serine/threonine protein kinase